MSDREMCVLVAQFTGKKSVAELLVRNLDEVEIRSGLKEETKKQKKR